MNRNAGGRPSVSPRTLLAAVAVLYLLAQLLVVADVPLGWDESIYTSQTDPSRRALAFTAPRARGMPWLAAPVQALTGSTSVLRGWFALLSSLSLYAAFAMWRRTLPGFTTPVAAAGFAGLWTAVFYGPSLMPNVLVALAGVYATGAMVAAAGGGRAWVAWAGGAAVAAATVIRPGDVVPLVAALGAAVLVHRPWRARAVRLLTPVLAGATVGALPWLVEAQLRYDGVLLRVRRALATQSTGERFVPDYQLRAVDGPLLCRPCSRLTQPVPPLGVLMWGVGAALVVLAVVLAVRGRVRPAEAVLLAAFAGAAQAVPYLFLVGYAAPRFLLPAYALLALPAASGALWLLAPRGVGAVPATAAGVLLLVGHLVIQGHWLPQVTVAQEQGRQRWTLVAAALHAHGVSPPCTLLGAESAPVAYLARCDNVRLGRPGDERFTRTDLTVRLRTERVAVVLRRSEKVPDYARGWTTVPRGDLPAGWRARVAPYPPG
ncbi:hypothetical protein [Knoellia koreensis]|uniref:Glycosyltransferase RgtA/B/C/D-like domain-containing protein n=1 Tax=Knoellia koreensis TaxID=2730921 RepID=A0A849HMS5_9MICO|nr:hypothetical protein [Knoellia sp. DB2414S]NNM47824.1 hypothetical protein [Knoellia sp. DB2414S]